MELEYATGRWERFEFEADSVTVMGPSQLEVTSTVQYEASDSPESKCTGVLVVRDFF